MECIRKFEAKIFKKNGVRFYFQKVSTLTYVIINLIQIRLTTTYVKVKTS